MPTVEIGPPLKVRDAAAEATVTEYLIRNAVTAGKLRTLQFGKRGRILISRSSFLEWLRGESA